MMGVLEYADALDLEHACFVTSECNGTPYRRSVNKVLYALENSPEFSRLVRVGGALKAMTATPQSLYQMREEDDLKIKNENRTENSKVFLANISKNDLDLGGGGVVCAKCKSTEISFSFSQTRSADEAMSTFCQCDVCGKRWQL